MNRRRSQSGYSVAAILAAFVVACVLASVGIVMLVQSTTRKPAPPPAAPTFKPTPPNGPATNNDIVKEWLEYESPGKEYKIRLPDGLTFYRFEKSPFLYTRDDLNLVSTAQAVVTEIFSGNDQQLGLFIDAKPYTEAVAPTARRGTKQASLSTTSQGLEIEHYVYEQKAAPAGIDIPKDSTEHSYYITNNFRTMTIRYVLNKSQLPNTAMVESIAKSAYLQ